MQTADKRRDHGVKRGLILTIKIIAVGKLKEKYWKDACSEYLKRLGGYASVSITEVPDADPARSGGVAGTLEKEEKGILAAIPERSHVILMAIEGKQRNSVEIAEHLHELALYGQGNLTFIIGGSDGVSSEIKKRADEMLSFGPITMPHNLARVVLLEQIYRAFRIIRGEPYHK